MLGRSLVSDNVNQQQWMEINGWVNYRSWVGDPRKSQAEGRRGVGLLEELAGTVDRRKFLR